VQGATFVLHLASPVPYKEPSKEDSEKVVKTAVEGALSVLRAAAKFGVKRVVLTSSIAAVRDLFPKDRLPAGQAYDESHWSDIEFQKTQAIYKVSKTL
jgi:nucleoside-diphosphate-sugar epimerase